MIKHCFRLLSLWKNSRINWNSHMLRDLACLSICMATLWRKMRSCMARISQFMICIICSAEHFRNSLVIRRQCLDIIQVSLKFLRESATQEEQFFFVNLIFPWVLLLKHRMACLETEFLSIQASISKWELLLERQLFLTLWQSPHLKK